MNTGYQGKKYEIFAYNGGLFKPDEVLDNIKITDELLVEHTRKLSEYDFESDVDVNILGHIFENSLSEIEEVTQQINSGETPQTSKRKQDGVFYTPQYITKYIVENTVGRLCTEKKQQLNIVEDEYFSDQRRQLKTKQRLLEQLQQYRDWLLQITILDPACGSGAFLNAALQFLMAEHKLIDEMEAKVAGSAIVFQDVENSILEHNLYGVDINEESVEIAQFALWLRTAKPHRKLNSLNENIKCGNSLISDPAIAGEKAFNWQEQFPKVFEKGGFDVVIGNPPYIPTERITSADKSYYEEVFQSAYGRINVYPLFYERGLKLLKNNGLLGYITPYTLMKNQYYIEARRYILDNCTILCLADFSGFPVFEDATVDSIILILQKQHYKKAVPYIFINHIKDFANGLYSIHEAIQSDILQHSDLSFSNIVSSFDFKKVSVGCVKLGEIVNFKQGIITGNNKKFLTKQEGYKTKKVITGSDFNRYALTWHNDYVIYDEKELHRPRVPGIFEVEQKLLLRQTGAYPICMIDTDSYYTLDTVHNGTLKDKRFNLKYIMCLINSTLHRYLYESSVNESGKVFAQVKIIYIDPLPIKVVDEAIQQPFVTLAETMLSLNQQLQEKRTRFLHRLSENFEGIKITTALQTFDQLDFKGFVAELKKQKIKLTLVQQDEWEDYFNQYRQACQELSEQIQTTDNEIDNKVFDLYGLTPEEREIVLKA
jgi:type I restriction-modification system DNA methylase subunit